MPSYRIGKLKGRFVLSVYGDDGERIHRYRLEATDKSGAEREAPGIFATLTKPRGSKVEDLWKAYLADHAGRAITENMPYTWKALETRFGTMNAESITVEDCRAHIKERRASGFRARLP